jgi:hypothetical protein
VRFISDEAKFDPMKEKVIKSRIPILIEADNFAIDDC